MFANLAIIRYEDGLKDVKEYIIEMITPPDAYITEDDIRKDEEAEIIRAELEREAVRLSTQIDLF